jgi:hypothetical protein
MEKPYTTGMAMKDTDIRSNLVRLGELAVVDEQAEILLIGGAAGILTGQLSPARTTGDCDVIRYLPERVESEVLRAARAVAEERGLPENWLNSKAASLDILPDGWRARRVPIGTFGKVTVSALSRKDLLATKFYAAHPRDVEDIVHMKPTAEEMAFVSGYLNILRVPSRQANLDQIERALRLLAAMEAEASE